MRKLFSILLVLSIAGLWILIKPLSKGSSHTKPRFDLSTSEGWNAYLLEQKKLKKKRPRPDKPDEAMEEEIALRSVIGEPFSYTGSWRFRAQRAALQSQPVLYKAAALNWVERGPGNFGGRTRSIVVHPNDSNTWWAGAVGGGIWKTTDAGSSWRSVTDDLPVLSVTAIDICKDQPDILYAGTGEGFYNIDAIIGDGVFKSTDGGETWTQIGSTASNYNFRYVNRLIVHPQHPDTLVVATNNGVYRSENGGNTWTEVFNNGNRVQQIIANPLRWDTQFIAVNASGIYKSTNGGLTWNYVSEEIVDHYRIEMAISETDTNIVYASPVDGNSGLLGFFRSPDAGNNWFNYGNSTNWLGGQGWYDNALVVSPLDPDIVFVGGIDIYRVTINGATMSVDKLTNWYSGAGYPYVHADQHAFVTIKDGSSNFAIISGNDGGVFYSSDMGSTWESKDNNYNVTQYYDGDRHPGVNAFIGGTQDNGTHRSPDEPNNTSSWSRVIGGDGFDCAWNKTEPSIVYGTLYNTRIYKSTDGGYNFVSINNNLPESNIFHTPLAMDPDNSDKLFTAGDNNKFYWTNDGGNNWNEVTTNYNGYTRVKIAVSEASSSIVWTGSTTIYTNVSTDSGLTFSQVTQPPGSPHAYLTGISTHPTQDSTAFLTIGSSGYGKIYRTRDLGQTWTDITNNLPDVPVFTVLVMPFDTSEIWIGTDIGLFISYDAGSSWQYSNNGLPAVSIRRLKIVNQEIVAATHGRGIWSVHRDELDAWPPLAPSLQDITVPNPNTGILKIRFTANSDYDSALVYVNNLIVDKLFTVPAGKDTFGLYSTNPPEYVTAKVVGYKSGAPNSSDEKSNNIYAAVDTLLENFDDYSSTFFGDFQIQDVTGFSTPALHSPHPYSDKTTYLSYLGTPITLKSGAYFRYSDVAIVEPGEAGSVYPDENFWDYVTVEATDDGDNWTIIVDPYDSRYDSAWETAYNNGNDGDESMYRTHDVSLTNYYPLDTKVYIRFKLYSDANTTGWGWAIDDIESNNLVSDLARSPAAVNTFALIGNYPNPFNPSTTIMFTLEKKGPVTLEVFNSIGQKVRTLYKDAVLEPGQVHRVVWDGTNDQLRGVSSGMYVYRLRAGEHRALRKMLLLR
ncbi:MAG: T9SS type A sorting domain-containing protein [Calditrichaeota bacterium]|nr:T9SS type A sorting domain-containing protein [Calditrichota bacterium]